MPLESRNVSEAPEESLGSLGVCLVEGDPEQRRRERRVRRRSLFISILIQTAALGLLILLPLFSKTQTITLAITTPIPPYGHPPHHTAGIARAGTGHASVDPFLLLTVRPVPPPNTGESVDGPPDIESAEPGGETGPACSWCIDIGGKDSGPRPPQPAVDTKSKSTILRMTHLDPAMLIYRVDPIYPPLAKQIHKEGRVELRAIIATDGTIQSLEVVGGDPIFFQSALEAVHQWRYKPTVLNGQPVQIDTHITVIYSMTH